ncbi:hypothetical protein D5P86_00375 [Salmonella enterica subsp. enterica serovar Infantis]|nr:hypothetical protein [Salmonella enterica subsp. enterica serovar Infantis]
MSFDMRQNVLMVRSLIHGQPFYYFYNAEGLEFSLSGYQLKEIYDCHFEGRMAAVTTYWGFSNKPNYESFEFAENGDLLWHVSLNATCSTLLPIEMINGHEGFNVINGFMIDDHKRNVIKIHQKAVGRTVERLTWFRDMSEERMRELLNALGHGPLRIERADREELIKIHRDWQRKHDEDFKYTHNACGIDPDDKLPADLYDDHGKWLRQRHMARGKTLDMMASELANIVRIFELDDTGDFDYMNPDWDEGLRRVAQAFIYGPNAKERFAAVEHDSQMVINGIYALAKDETWITINEESQDYQESLFRRLMQELKNEIERPNSVFAVEEGIVYLKAMSATADAESDSRNKAVFAEKDEDVVDEVEEDEEEDEDEDDSEMGESHEVRLFLDGLSDNKLRGYAKLWKLANAKRIAKMSHAELVDICADYCGAEYPEDLEEEAETEKEREPRKFMPATRSADTIDYVRVRKILVWSKLPTGGMSVSSAGSTEVSQNRKKAIAVLRSAILDNDLLDKMSDLHLRSLAYALTKMKDGDRYPRGAEYLKEVIKHALR